MEENEFDIFENELVRAYNKSNELLEKLRIIRNSGKFKILNIDDNDLMSIELLFTGQQTMIKIQSTQQLI